MKRSGTAAARSIAPADCSRLTIRMASTRTLPTLIGLIRAPSMMAKKLFGVEAGAADQCAVDVGLRDQRGDVVGLDASAIEHAAAFGRVQSEPLLQPLRMCKCASPACAGVALRPVPIAHTGS